MWADKAVAHQIAAGNSQTHASIRLLNKNNQLSSTKTCFSQLQHQAAAEAELMSLASLKRAQAVSRFARAC